MTYNVLMGTLNPTHSLIQPNSIYVATKFMSKFSPNYVQGNPLTTAVLIM